VGHMRKEGDSEEQKEPYSEAKVAFISMMVAAIQGHSMGGGGGGGEKKKKKKKKKKKRGVGEQKLGKGLSSMEGLKVRQKLTGGGRNQV